MVNILQFALSVAFEEMQDCSLLAMEWVKRIEL